MELVPSSCRHIAAAIYNHKIALPKETPCGVLKDEGVAATDINDMQ
jgi:hypothetical protein